MVQYFKRKIQSFLRELRRGAAASDTEESLGPLASELALEPALLEHSRLRLAFCGGAAGV